MLLRTITHHENKLETEVSSVVRPADEGRFILARFEPEYEYDRLRELTGRREIFFRAYHPSGTIKDLAAPADLWLPGIPNRLEWTWFTGSMTNKPPLIPKGIRAKLETARVARLATLQAKWGPHVIPICFACHGNVFYSAIDCKPKRVARNQLTRLKNVEKTPQVAFLVDHYDEDWARLWYILVRGEAELVSTSIERKHAIQLLRVKYPQYGPDMLPDDAPVLRITPRRVTAWGDI